MSATRFRLITFDVYTALFDVIGSLVPVVERIHGQAGNAQLLVRNWRAKQLEYAQLVNSLQRGRVSFRAVTERAMDFTFRSAALPLADGERRDLIEAWDRLRPWPEAASALSALKSRGYQIAVLSNGDEAMLRQVIRAIDVEFDHVFASDHAGFYKPHPAMYALPLAASTVQQEQILHVAGSGNDVLGAKCAGLHCAWSNRHGEPALVPEFAADYCVSDLSGLLDIL